MHNPDVEFDKWYDMLLHELKVRGYDNPPDTATAMGDYDLGVLPEKSADLFIKEWTTGNED